MFGFVYFFNGIYTPCGLFNAEILLICKCLIVIVKTERKKKYPRDRYESKYSPFSYG